MAAKLARLFLLAAVTALEFLAPARAADPAPAVLILDSSGSMSARMPDGRIKLDAARAVVADALAKWPAGGELAVVAYGHRRKSDCGDIETIVDMAPVSAGKIEESLDRLRARGKTPISQSLRQAATLLPAAGGTIVLVSDGLETCDADPCAVAADLKKANARLVIHVVGFGLAKGEGEQLTCIAENVGGRFFEAENAGELTSALSVVTETVASEPPPPPPPPPPSPEPSPVEAEAPPTPDVAPKSSSDPNVMVRVHLKAVAGDLGIIDASARWTVMNGEGKTFYEGDSRALTLDLPAGPYKAVAEAANARGEAEIATTGETNQSFDVNVMAGRLDLSLAANKGAAPFGDTETQGIVWIIEPLDGQGKPEVPQIAKPAMLLAPGKYRVAAELKGMKAEAMAEVTPGKAKAVILDFQLGAVTLEAVLDGEDKPIADATMLKWRVGEGDRAQIIAGQARPRLVLPQGKYPVVLTIAGGEVKGEAEAKAGEDKVVRVVVGGGELALSARLGPDSASLDDWRDTMWTVAPANAEPDSPAIKLPVAQPVVPVPPGRWRISLQSGTVTAQKEVDVGPGAKLPITLDLDAARLTARGRSADGPPPGNIVFSFAALRADGTPADQPAFEEGASEETYAILKAGRYRVSATDSDGRSAEEDVELKSGDERTLELTLR